MCLSPDLHCITYNNERKFYNSLFHKIEDNVLPAAAPDE